MHAPMPLVMRVVGAGLLIAGTTVLVDCFARFVFQWRGTPAPVAPTETLVVIDAIAPACGAAGRALRPGR
jgi:hypothetical protein